MLHERSSIEGQEGCWVSLRASTTFVRRVEGLEKLENALGGVARARRGVLVCGGGKRQRRSSSDIVPWHALSGVDWFGS